jgi:large subunit ribosomal protein L3
MQGLIGKKIRMTSVFDARGHQVPVTVVECGPCVVIQRKEHAHEGYEAVQVAFGDIAEKKLNKPEMGIFKKTGVAPKKYRHEFRLEKGEDLKTGDIVTVKIFDGISHVDVNGISKGKGFQGVMRRHHMSGGPMTHGGHSKRRVGSVGCRELPGRIHKGKHMPGHMGNISVTTRNLRIVEVRPEDNALLIGGAVPGPSGSIVAVTKSLKVITKK